MRLLSEKYKLLFQFAFKLQETISHQLYFMIESNRFSTADILIAFIFFRQLRTVHLMEKIDIQPTKIVK
ncbi:hypothetical protein BOQ64_02390 [Chryseobacterium sp. CH25]|nr:hypothetical protein BOQ64_02390 [Chryseobacterium sp. CH25]RXM65552.1 hypothetical protein BOQ60_07100 [Chryseobacterium sp. CH1]